MKKIFTLLTVALLALCASCDKIEPNDMGEYTIYAGMVFDWSDGQGVADHTQRALIEKYTGVRCPNCPDGDVAINALLHNDQYQGRLFAVAVHGCTGNFGKPINGFDPKCDDAIEWMTALIGQNSGLPAALVMRKKKEDGNIFTVNPATTDLTAPINAVLDSAAAIAISATCRHIAGNSYEATVELQHLRKLADVSSFTVTAFLMEDGIIGPQRWQSVPGGQVDEYEHNHVLRDVLTDIWGCVMTTDGKVGTKIQGIGRFETPKGCTWNPAKCKVVVFVSDAATKRILNVAECELADE